MSVLGLELSDAGIMVATHDPVGLLQIDGAERESSGFALPEGGRLLVGRTAEDKAHLHPRRFNNIFWSQLNTEPLKQPNPHARNHAEMAYTHLARIWDSIKEYGDELVMAVPGFLERDQLGLLLGIAEELSIPLKGIVALPVAASSTPCPGRMLVHLDIHLHGSEVNFLEQGKSLNLKDSVTAEGQGLHNLHREWVETIAAEFVRTTRFDPLHRADFEQALYNRLPSILMALEHEPLVMCEMTAGSKTHRVSLSRDLFKQKSEPTFSELLRLIEGIRNRYGGESQPLALQLTHRIHRLPGCKEMVAKMTDAQTIQLEPGSGAFGSLNLKEELNEQRGKKGVSYLMSRPWSKQQTTNPRPSSQPVEQAPVQPTHILYRNMAYPISDQPLTIGWGGPEDGVRMTMGDELADVSKLHCAIQIRNKEVVLTDHSTSETFVDETPVTDTAVLKLGQIIRIGTPGEKLQLIACLEKDET
jgi:hypothetical protein